MDTPDTGGTMATKKSAPNSAPAALPYVRPMPPEHLARPALGFARATEVEDFVAQHFLDRAGLFFDPEHGHLSQARVGVLWAASRHSDRGSEKAGTAELVKAGDPSKWGDAVRLLFMREMFGPTLPTFKITLHAPTCAMYDDRQFFALLDHELSHCAVAKDQWGTPRFSESTGLPVWATRPHDHEGFVGTTERWGSAASGAAGIVAAGAKPARFAWVPGTDLDVHKACGNR